MEEYRVKLKLQNLFIAIACFALAAFAFLNALNEAGVISFLPPVDGNSHHQSMWRGFLTGASTGLLGFFGFGLIRNIRALRDDEILKKQYIKDNDERVKNLFIVGAILMTVTGAWLSVCRAYDISGRGPWKFNSIAQKQVKTLCFCVKGPNFLP